MQRALWCLALAVASCDALAPVRGEDDARENGSVYAGPECEARSNDTDETKSDVYYHICGSFDGRGSTQPALALRHRHQAFDDRRPDLVAAALNVIDGAASEGYGDAIGMSTYYAELLQEDTLAARVDTLGLPSEAKDAFVRKAMAAKPTVVAMAANLDARRKHMYVDAPHAVIDARRAYFQAHAALYAKLDGLEARAADARTAHKAPAELVRGLNGVRGEYLATCKDDACRFDPFVIEVTRELVVLHALAGDMLAAQAENYLLREPAAGRHLFAVETGTALYAAMSAERHAWEQYAKAKQDGVDGRTLELRFGSPPPVKVDPETDYVGSDELPDLAKALGAGDAAKFTGGIVSMVADAGRSSGANEPLAIVTFRDHVTTEDVTECYETGRVAGIRYESDGRARLEYENVCNAVGTKANVEKVPPVLVVKSEVARIRPGESLLAAVAPDTRIGVVVRSTIQGNSSAPQKKTLVVQVRGARLGAG